jgi:quercetin dioxygenase-like cupin family protein
MVYRSIAVLCLLSTFFLSAESEVEVTAEPSHHLVLENQFVRVFRVEVPPHSSTLLHRHRHDFLIVALIPADIVNEVVGQPPAPVKLATGEASFKSGGFVHRVRNQAATPFLHINIELQKDAEARQSPPPKWDEERGLNILHGGTQDILFVKDGVRVSEIDLQPGGMMHPHYHKGPHLMVAVTDLELRSDVTQSEIGGTGPMVGKFKAGDAKWLPGGYTHTLTNTGTHPAKFVTLEFP